MNLIKLIKAALFIASVTVMVVALHPNGTSLSFKTFYEFLIICCAMGLIFSGIYMRKRISTFFTFLFLSGGIIILLGVAFLPDKFWLALVLICLVINVIFTYFRKPKP